MCFDHDSKPPIEVGPRAAQGIELVLTARDGNRFSAFEAAGTPPSRAGVVILPDVRGLFGFYKNLALLFAHAGHDAVAIDYFGRTAGLGTRPAEWDFWPHVYETSFATVRDDVAAAVSHLRTNGPSRPVFTVGFCFGGSASWHQAANGLSLSGAVGFYGQPRRAEENVGAIDRVAGMSCPVLALMGGNDPGIPMEEVRMLEAAFVEASVPHEVIVYEDAPHSFFDRKYADYASESADAWERVLHFIAANIDPGRQVGA